MRTSTSSLRARKTLPALVALLTLDLATPLELAVTRHGAHFNIRHVAPIAAHQIATVRRQRRHVAFPALRTQAPRAMVGRAIIRRSVRVDEILTGRWFDCLALRNKIDAVVARDHLRRAIVTILQPFADLPKRRHHQPTGLHRTGTGHSMAATSQLHITSNCLMKDEWTEEKSKNNLNKSINRSRLLNQRSLTNNPAMLLCVLTRVLMSLRLRMRASRNALDLLSPNWTLSLHPPHFQSPPLFFTAFAFFSCRFRLRLLKRFLMKLFFVVGFFLFLWLLWLWLLFDCRWPSSSPVRRSSDSCWLLLLANCV